MMKAWVVCDANIGNSVTTYWRSTKYAKHRFSILLENNDVMRDKKGRALRYATRNTAIEAAKKAGFQIIR